MRLSIVTPTLNQRAYLERCVASLAGLNIEHIVSDGGSSDGTVEAMKAPNRQGIRFLSEPDTGMYQALNRGFAVATGDIFGYVNSDDTLFPWTPALVLRFFETHSTVDWVVGDALEICGNRVAPICSPPYSLLDFYFSAGLLVPQTAVFFRRRLFEKLGGFDETYQLLGDHDLFTRAQKTSPGARLWEVLAVQRNVDGRLMQRRANEARCELIRIHDARSYSRPNRVVSIAVRAVTAGVNRAALGATRFPFPPWQALRYSGWVKPVAVTRLARSLVSSTRGHALLELTGQGESSLEF